MTLRTGDVVRLKNTAIVRRDHMGRVRESLVYAGAEGTVTDATSLTGKVMVEFAAGWHAFLHPAKLELVSLKEDIGDGLDTRRQSEPAVGTDVAPEAPRGLNHPGATSVSGDVA